MQATDDDFTTASRFNTVQKPDIRLLHVLSIISVKYGRRYCYPALRTVRSCLARFHGRRMSERTIIRHMNALRDQGYIKRKKRHCTGHGGRLELHSSLYVVIGRGWRSLVGLRNAVAAACGYPGGPLQGYAVTQVTGKALPQGIINAGLRPLRC